MQKNFKKIISGKGLMSFLALDYTQLWLEQKVITIIITTKLNLL